MDGRTKAIIGILLIPSFLIGTDFAGALMLVMPIEREYSADITTTQWVLNAYALSGVSSSSSTCSWRRSPRCWPGA